MKLEEPMQLSTYDDGLASSLERVEKCTAAFDDDPEEVSALADALADLERALAERGRLDETEWILDRLEGLYEKHADPAVRDAYVRALAPIEYESRPESVGAEIELEHIRDRRDRLESLHQSDSECAVRFAETLAWLADEREERDLPTDDQFDRLEALYDAESDPRIVPSLGRVLPLRIDSPDTFTEYVDRMERFHDRHDSPYTAAGLVLAESMVVYVHRDGGNAYRVEEAKRTIEELIDEFDHSRVSREYGLSRLVLLTELPPEEAVTEGAADVEAMAERYEEDPDAYLEWHATTLGLAVRNNEQSGKLETAEQYLDRLEGLADRESRPIARQWLAEARSGLALSRIDAGATADAEAFVADLRSLHDEYPMVAVRRVLTRLLPTAVDPERWADEPPRDEPAELPAELDQWIDDAETTLEGIQDEYGGVTAALAGVRSRRVARHAMAGAFDEADAALADLQEYYESHVDQAVRSEYARALAADARWSARVPAADAAERVRERFDRLETLYERYPEPDVVTAFATVAAERISLQPSPDLDIRLGRVQSLYEDHAEGSGDALAAGYARALAAAVEIAIEGAARIDSATRSTVEDRVERLRELYDQHPTATVARWTAEGIVQLNWLRREDDESYHTALDIAADRVDSLHKRHDTCALGRLTIEAYTASAFHKIEKGDWITIESILDNVDELIERSDHDLVKARAEFLGKVGEALAQLDTAEAERYRDRLDALHREIENGSEPPAIVDRVAERRADLDEAIEEAESADRAGELVELLVIAAVQVVIILAVFGTGFVLDFEFFYWIGGGAAVAFAGYLASQLIKILL